MVGSNVACDRKKPWLQRPTGLVRMARLEQRHENLLINVLHFIAGDARSQETGHGGSYVVEQEAAGIPIPALHALHQLCAYPAAFESPRVNSLFYSPSAALGHGSRPLPPDDRDPIHQAYKDSMARLLRQQTPAGRSFPTGPSSAEVPGFKFSRDCD